MSNILVEVQPKPFFVLMVFSLYYM